MKQKKQWPEGILLRGSPLTMKKPVSLSTRRHPFFAFQKAIKTMLFHQAFAMGGGSCYCIFFLNLLIFFYEVVL